MLVLGTFFLVLSLANKVQSTKSKEQTRILHEATAFVRKEVSIANSMELTKLYNPLTDSLRLISIQSALSLGVNALYPRQ